MKGNNGVEMEDNNGNMKSRSWSKSVSDSRPINA